MYSDCPIPCLKETQSSCSLSEWDVTVSPLSVFRLAMTFLLCLIVALAWKNLVQASPRVAHLIAPLYFQYILCCSSSVKSFSIRMHLKFHSSKLRSLYSSIASRSNKVKEMFAMLIFRLERVELQALRAPLRFLKFSSKEVVQMETKYSQNKLF